MVERASLVTRRTSLTSARGADTTRGQLSKMVANAFLPECSSP